MYLIRAILIVICLKCSNGIKDAESPADGTYLETALASGQVIVRKSLTQSEALHYCETRGSGGGRLAVLPDIDNAKELVNAIHTISQKWTNDKDAAQRTHEFGMSRRYWIGLVDLVSEGEWVWQKEGSVLQYDFWYPGQPDHTKKPAKAGDKPRIPEHCVTLWNPIFYENETHTFNDEICTNKHYFICDAPAVAQKGRSMSGWSADSNENSNEQSGEDPASGGTVDAPETQQMGRSFSSKLRVENFKNDTKDNSSEEYPGIVVDDPNQHQTQMGRSFSFSSNSPAEDFNNDTNDNSTEDIHFGGTADEHKNFSGTVEGEDSNSNNNTNEILEEEFPLVVMDDPVMNPLNNSTDGENEIGDSSKSRAPNEGANESVNPSMGRMSSTSSGGRDEKVPEDLGNPVQERRSSDNSSTSDNENGTSTEKAPETPRIMGRAFHSIPTSDNENGTSTEKPPETPQIMGRAFHSIPTSDNENGTSTEKPPETPQVMGRAFHGTPTSDNENGTSTEKPPETPKIMGRSFGIPRSNNGTSHRGKTKTSSGKLKHRKVSKHSSPRRPSVAPQKSQAKTPVKSEKQNRDAVQALITPQIKGMKAFNLDKLL